MKQLLKDLKSVSKTLKQLATKADLIMTKLEKMDASKSLKSAAGPRTGKTPGKGPGKGEKKKKEAVGVSATQHILDIISGSKDGAGTCFAHGEDGTEGQ